jgi:ubiquinone/menaquinone biosynthesis C-methylase UbiE
VPEAEPKKYNYTFPVDGFLRRLPHEFFERKAGVEAYYDEVLRRMDISQTDSVLDIGAGIGFDALTISRKYGPELIYAMEPSGQNDEESDYKFILLNEIIELDGIKNIEPLFGVAEDIPLPDKSVSKVLMVHTAYEFTDLPQALSETRRVLKDDGLGVLVTNGTSDKYRFGEMLREMGKQLLSKSPNKVSQNLNYEKAFIELHKYFDAVDVFTQKGVMEVTEDRLPVYLWQFDSYRSSFNPPVLNDGRWEKVKKTVVEDPISAEMAANKGVFTDTIDISAIYFRHKSFPNTDID